MNFAENLTEVASKSPNKPAVILSCSRNRFSFASQMSYGELNQRSNGFAHGLSSIGIKKGMRVSFLVKPNLDFLPLIYALYKIGAVPVLIDPGMGSKNLFKCISRSKPEAFIGIPKAHVARLLFPKYFCGIKIYVSSGRFRLPNTFQLNRLRNNQSSFSVGVTPASDTAAIIFTTGSTGPPKGVIFTHGMFCTQTKWIKELYQVTPDDIDMPGFSLFAIFSIAIGMTVVIPDMDPTRPANVNPKKIIETINKHSVTFSFGSPALWNRVSLFCVENKVTLPSVKRILMAGAPIPPYLHQRLLGKILPNSAKIHTPYGATESLLVSSFTGDQVLAETVNLTRQGKGYCVGRPLPDVNLKIIRVTDHPISHFNEIKELPPGQIGEIIIKSPVVSPKYFELPEQDLFHKIYENSEGQNDPPWHRIGDIGYLDTQGRLWFCGRKTHRVETGEDTMYTVCCEAIFNEHPHVFRSALVGIGSDRYRQTPAIVVEPLKKYFPKQRIPRDCFKDKLLELARKNPLTREITHILFHPKFPVDIRHNAKIFREILAQWAQGQIS